MQLILVRHGEAEPYQANDAIRNLTASGVIQAHSTAEQVLAKYHPDLFVVSPYKRAQQTMAAFQSKYPQVPLHILEGITPDADPIVALDELSILSEQYSAKCMVVVCHMNVVAYMAALLIEEDPENFGLAEARIFEQPMIVMGLSVEKARFSPTGDLH
ncbi:MAG: phosphohistidine phosphatase SixA [Gammaproteobacteria bacterium]|nr:phosphohistidine phosphatase SixA [Gammaproteobacteria bacterium]